jgi:DNA segregation ATPase FtsK/SpoIIIE, S-DNA-T family
MVRTSGKSSGTAVLPLGTVQFLRRRLCEGVGTVLIAVGVALLAAEFTYSSGDPSFNSVADGGVTNILGPAGAFTADLFLQFFGAAGALPALVMTVWGWRMIRKRGIVLPWMRVVMLTAALFLLAMALDPLPAPEMWPLMGGLGGAAGGYLMDGLSDLADGLGLADPTFPLAVTGAFLGGAAAIAAFGVPWSEWRTGGQRLARAMALAWSLAVRLWGFFRQRTPVKAEKTERPRKSVTRTHERPAETRVEAKKPEARAGKRERKERQGNLDLDPSDAYRLPSLDLLDQPAESGRGRTLSQGALEENARLLESVLEDFGIRGTIVKVRPGPVVTLYELEPAPGTKTSRVIGLSHDIARSMSAISVRVAVIPGRNVIGIELPNARRETVHLRELVSSDAFERTAGKLALALGKDIGGTPVMVDLARMPHLLIAGTTGSGKSVAINTMILALLYQLSPEQCRIIMIDPKMLELTNYEGIPHLLCPVVTEPAKAIMALKWAVREMEERYRAMSQLGVRNIAGYNTRLIEAAKKKETLTRRVQTGFDGETGKPIFEDQPLSMEPLPLIVVVVDEMADLMLVAGKDIEAAVQRLAQMARAAGIHLIMATQRPSVDVITGTIKANFPTRISFQVTSKIDSRTILGEQGAEQLLGQGDMLYMAGGGRISRVHGPFVSDEEVERVVSFLRSQGEPAYMDEVTEEDDGGFAPVPGANAKQSGDPLYDEAVAVVAREGKASTSFIQRHLQIGYNRAARIIERMEVDGVVGKANRVGRREVLIGDHGS